MDMGYIIEYAVAICMSIVAFFCKVFGQDKETTDETVDNIESMLNGLFGYEPEV